MNTKSIASAVIALAAMSSMSAFADTSDYMPPAAATPSTLSRAEVAADAVKARKESTLQVTETAMPIAAQKTAPTSQLSREEVRKETLQAKKSNPFDYGNGAE
jgi:hypothetical protein